MGARAREGDGEYLGRGLLFVGAAQHVLAQPIQALQLERQPSSTAGHLQIVATDFHYAEHDKSGPGLLASFTASVRFIKKNINGGVILVTGVCRLHWSVSCERVFFVL